MVNHCLTPENGAIAGSSSLRLAAQIDDLYLVLAVHSDVLSLHEQWRVIRMGMKARLPTLGNKIQSVMRREYKETSTKKIKVRIKAEYIKLKRNSFTDDSRVVLGRTNNGQSLGHHHLVGTVRMQVNGGQKRSLAGMCLKMKMNFIKNLSLFLATGY